MEVNKMKKIYMALIIVSMVVAGCANTGRYNTQKGAAAGAGLGAIAGQAIGRNTEATLLGAGVGTVLGSLFGNLEDQRAADLRDQESVRQANYRQRSRYVVHERQPTQYVAPEPQIQTGPPGEWVTVPGRWEDNRWVPAHQEWRPVYPD
jgi:outer membrane lipoprotein SlyB